MGGTNFFNPATGAQYFTPNTTQAGFGQDLARDALIAQLTSGTGAQASAGRREELMREIEENERHLGVRGNEQNAYRLAQREMFNRELAALDAFQLPNLPGQIGVPTAEREVQLGEATGAFRDIAGEQAGEFFQQQQQDLGARGVLGSSIEGSLIGEQAQTLQDIDREAILLGENLRSMDVQQGTALLMALQSGADAAIAQGFQSQQLGAMGAAQMAANQFGQQQLQWQQQQQAQSALQQLLSTGGSTAMQLLQNRGGQQGPLTRDRGSGGINPYEDYDPYDQFPGGSLPYIPQSGR